MSTFLQLVNGLAAESRVSGSPATLTDVVNQSGDALRFVNWTLQAHREIQNRHPNWRWLRSSFTVNTVAGTDSYAPTVCTDSRLSALITRFGHWITHSEEGRPNITRYLTSGGVGGEMWLTFLPWSDFRSIYRRGTQNNNPPVHYSIDPQNNLVLGPKPDAVYTVNGEYQMGSFDLAVSGDTPEFPNRFHDVVMWRALDKYGRTVSAMEVVFRAESEGKRLMRQLEADQLPTITLGEPLC